MNTLDANGYRINIRDIDGFAKGKTPAERIKDIGMIAVATSVPVIIVACYLGELYGFSTELDGLIERLMHFYRIDKVLNVNDERAI